MRTIQVERLAELNEQAVRGGRYVLYWMQQAQRTVCNHALEYAAQQANALGLPVVVGFGLTDGYPEANARHYRFMLEGLQQVAGTLERRGIAFVLRKGDPADVAIELGHDAAMIVCDRGYLRVQKQWRDRVADEAGRRVVQVESDVVVPVEVASDKAEYAARTIRPRLRRQLEKYLVKLEPTPVKRDALGLKLDGVSLGDLDGLLDSLDVDRSVPPVSQHFQGGEAAARARLGAFLDERFGDYAAHRNRPETNDVSHMSKYLHFGQISPVQLALRVLERGEEARDENVASFIEELIVRRELAMNFVNYTPGYDSYACLPRWAQQTLKKHRGDEREHVYTRKQLEAGATHDAYWNAAMKEMRETGYMHNYMRMYWGKKILQWSNTPEHAYRVALALNNRWFLDGRDANSFANVAWVFGLHDRPWAERPVFGTVRYMAATGLERKCDIQGYVRKVEALGGDDGAGLTSIDGA
ncbi:deoxyribodipyrimidine photo-lyase [Phycisphaerales bacterium AB-hyl4]|uniref:Deoxyribodipyrimidine photo-lyase n=1 Tax=Natronomicrosphaera hydrolytica TaxID=3242702 RepID=A0ABV4U7R1_9BACT